MTTNKIIYHTQEEWQERLKHRHTHYSQKAPWLRGMMMKFSQIEWWALKSMRRAYGSAVVRAFLNHPEGGEKVFGCKDCKLKTCYGCPTFHREDE